MVPGFTPELGTRIGALYESAGGIAAAAELVGYSTETLRSWRGGKARMPLHAAAVLCKAAGRPVDWLVTGEEPPPAGGVAEERAPFQGELDEAQLRQCIETVEEGLKFFGLERTAAEKADLVVKMYRIAEERGIKPGETMDLFKAS